MKAKIYLLVGGMLIGFGTRGVVDRCFAFRSGASEAQPAASGFASVSGSASAASTEPVDVNNQKPDMAILPTAKKAEVNCELLPRAVQPPKSGLAAVVRLLRSDAKQSHELAKREILAGNDERAKQFIAVEIYANIIADQIESAEAASTTPQRVVSGGG